jgi:hypothetical protein
MRIWLFGALAILLASSPSSACDCGRAGPACTYISHAAVAFIGTVTFSDDDDSGTFVQRTLVKFKVEEAFKGLAPETQDVWIDPGSFTSCYANYDVGKRYLVFAQDNLKLLPGTPAMSIATGPGKQKLLPKDIDPAKPPIVYEAPECSGTREVQAGVPYRSGDIEYLRAYRAGTAKPLILGRAFDDLRFGGANSPGLPGVNLTLTGSGINRSTRTDANGDYIFARLPAGAYMVTPSLYPYVADAKIRQIDVPHIGCGAEDFDMRAQGVIEGTLLDAAGRPAASVWRYCGSTAG